MELVETGLRYLISIQLATISFFCLLASFVVMFWQGDEPDWMWRQRFFKMRYWRGAFYPFAIGLIGGYATFLIWPRA